jgi:hypothetical protein
MITQPHRDNPALETSGASRRGLHDALWDDVLEGQWSRVIGGGFQVMTQRVARPTLRLRLSGTQGRDGEIPLADLAKVAEQTQLVITRLARGLIDGPALGRLRKSVVEATTMSLVGVHAGSTVLEIAGPELDSDTAALDDMPADLSEIVISTLVDSLDSLSEPEPSLPVGVDSRAVKSINNWLRALRRYDRVSLKADLNSGTREAEIQLRSARDSLEHAEPQPSIPFVSAHHQALTGRLYALNLRTGSFSIEDDAGHSIRLSVPEDMRSEAAQLVDTRVRAIGNASLDERRRLMGFDVAALEPLPPEFVVNQEEFFQRHELVESPPLPAALDIGIIPDLTDDEVNDFIAAFEAE